ncbi:hypothetical protein HD806DRAFT_433197 [Xylariaceae sp. AK1471]|nr:hypothetical protein HD806DRAFT_433197 [Xylariaceae sp. AK1471]
MPQYFDSDIYGDDGFYPSERRDSAESSLSPTPMARELSGESAITTYSTDAILGSPSPEYEAYEPVWSPVPESGYDNAFPSTSYDPAYISEANEYVTDSGNYYNTNRMNTAGEHMEWWQYYDFIANVDSGQQAYWRLKPGFTPTAEYPETRIPEDHSAAVPRSQANEGMFVCLEQGCSRTFRRKADLIRHYGQKHTPSDKKPKYPCDWKKCQRYKDPFHRIDHQRDHYRDYHLEDLMRRGSSGKEDKTWWRSRKVNPDWFRCARCLERVSIQKSGYKCPKCKTSCETERQYYRSR